MPGFNINLTTYKDLRQHALDFLGANVSAEAKRDSRRAVLNAYRELANAFRWTYYYQRGRIDTVRPQTLGTVTYDSASLTVTLTGTTWPSWAAYGVLTLVPAPGSLGTVAYQVATRVDDQTLLLSNASHPQADITTPTAYTLYRDTYSLPTDCLAIERQIMVNNAFAMWYEHPGIWMERQRIYRTPATPRVYTVRGDPKYMGSMAISYFPAPDNLYQFDFIYQRRPRQLITDEYNTGSVSYVQGTTEINGTGTNWLPGMAGSVIRLSADGINLPDGLVGDHPRAIELVINSVNTTTNLTTDFASSPTLSGVKYTISDPADVEEGAMLTALLRGIEWQVALSRNMKVRGIAEGSYKQALIAAREADSRDFAVESAGQRHLYPYRLAQMPRGPDVS